MRILAIDTSGLVASAALVTEERLVVEYTVDYKKTHSQTLLPMVAELKKMLELDLSTLDAIAVAQGPGSFTGLRIGAATAKGLGLALDLPLVPVPTVDALAYNLAGAAGIVCPLMNARRNQAYTGIYEYDGFKQVVLRQQCVTALSDILQDVNGRGGHVSFLGDGIPVFKEQIEKECTVPFSFAPAHLAQQRAGAVGALGMLLFQEGKAVNADDFVPVYLRLSQAERERKEKLEKEKAQAKENAGDASADGAGKGVS